MLNTRPIIFIFTVSLFAVAGLLFSACSSMEPMLPDDVAKRIEENLGYALAPIWMPKGFEYCGPFIEDNPHIEQAFNGQVIAQAYQKIMSTIETNRHAMTYPVNDSHFSLEEKLGLVPPDDVVSTVKINGEEARLYRGTWSLETLRRVARLQTPINPEWDYKGGGSIRFSISVPDKGDVLVYIRTVFSGDEVTLEDLTRIAKSVVVIE